MPTRGKPTRKESSNLDFGGAIRNSHEQKADALRVLDMDNLVNEYWSRADNLVYDSEGSLTSIDFLYDQTKGKYKIQTVADVAGSLNNTYFLLDTAQEAKKYYVWYNVGATGTDPMVAGRTGIAVPIAFNDSAAIVALATKLILDATAELKATGVSNVVTIENVEFGTSSISDVSTGFTLTTVIAGTSEVVKSIELVAPPETKYLYNEFEKQIELYDFVEFHSDFVETTPGGDKALRVQGEISIVTDPNNNNEIVNAYTEASSVPASVLTTIGTFTAPVGKTTFLQRVSAGGQNIATFQVEVNGSKLEKRRTYFSGDLTTDFVFGGFSESGYPLTVGDVVTVKVTHSRPLSGDFESKIQALQVG